MIKQSQKIVVALLLTVFLLIPVARADESKRMHCHGDCPERHGMMMGDGACPFLAKNTKISVEDTKNGVTIQVTSSDKKDIERIQKKAKIMQLMHELHQLE